MSSAWRWTLRWLRSWRKACCSLASEGKRSGPKKKDSQCVDDRAERLSLATIRVRSVMWGRVTMMVRPRDWEGEDNAVGVGGSGLVGTRRAERPESSSGERPWEVSHAQRESNWS